MLILINTPDINSSGGIANYYKTIKKYFKYNVEYNYIGGSRRRKKLTIFIFKLLEYYRFVKKIRKLKPQIIQLNPSFCADAVVRDAIFLIISKLFRKKVIIFFRGWKFDFERKVEKYHKRLFSFVFNKADGFCVLSEDFKKKLESWEISKPVYVETTVVDDSFVKGISIETKKYNNNNILFLARLYKEKGIYEALLAFKILSDINKDLKLTIAGDGPEKENAIMFSKKHNLNVDFIGYADQIKKKELFKKADIYLFPSYTEGMPTSVLEAMAFGLPIISREVGGLVDFFKNDKMGYITKSFDPVVFAELILKLNTPEIRSKIGNYNFEYAQANFLASKAVSRLEKIYDNIIN